VVPFLTHPRVPALHLDSGTFLFSPNPRLVHFFLLAGKEPSDLTNQWLEWEATELQPAVSTALYRHVVQGKKGGEVLGKTLSYIDQRLTGKAAPYLAGPAPSAAPLASRGRGQGLPRPPPAPSAAPLASRGRGQGLPRPPPAPSAAPLASRGRGQGLPRPPPAPSAAPLASRGRGQGLPRPPPAPSAAPLASRGRGQGLPRPPPAPSAAPLASRGPHCPRGPVPQLSSPTGLGSLKGRGSISWAPPSARYCRLRNWNTLYVCGTDEYGTATETKALEEGLTPQQICDKYNTVHTQIYRWFDISFDYFGRTTTAHQTTFWVWISQALGWPEAASVGMCSCSPAPPGLPAQPMAGRPHPPWRTGGGRELGRCLKELPALVGTPLAQGCPGPGSRLSFQTDMAKAERRRCAAPPHSPPRCRPCAPRCSTCGSMPRSAKRPSPPPTPIRPPVGLGSVPGWEWDSGLLGSAHRSAAWPFPSRRAPGEVQLYNFMAKDNVPFHSVVFPCTLLGTQENYTLGLSPEYLNYEDGKFSKSRGVGVFGDMAQDTGIPADIWRFYLLFLRPEGQGSAFSWHDPLLNNLGNFVNRAGMFVCKFFAGRVPSMELGADDKRLLAHITLELRQYNQLLEKVRSSQGQLRGRRCAGSHGGNPGCGAGAGGGSDAAAPFSRVRAGTVTGVAINIASLISVMLQPYMPSVSATIQRQLCMPQAYSVLPDAFLCLLPPGHQIGTVSPLFQKLENEQIEALRKRFGGGQANQTPPGAGEGAGLAGDPQKAKELAEEVAKQGAHVRQLKASKQEKGQIDAAVARLLELKQQLALAEGKTPEPLAAKGKKKK
uniref:methionine--tRNA ligase n=1 Tax=Pelodiscus sinensis TaxID=13735 RepID=K7G4T8_PELSI